MLLKADAAQLEWRVKVWLAQDQIAISEINEKKKFHEDNQKTFGLPTKVIAKIFLFRMIFADAFGDRGFSGPAYAYSKDSDFMGTSMSPKFWEKVIEKFFDKYQGVYEHSLTLIRQATTTGRIEIPTGRFYKFSQLPNRKWPHTTILNYPVQGFSADYMKMVRLLLRKRLKSEFKGQFGRTILLINTVHDDIEADVDNDPKLVYNVCILLEECFREAPKLLEKNYGCYINIPLEGEVKLGWTLYDPDPPKVGDLIKFNPASFNEDFEKLCKFRLSK